MQRTDIVKEIALLGSTGSIGAQTLDVCRRFPDRFRIVALVAGRSAQLLADQAHEFHPDMTVLAEAEPPVGSEILTGQAAVIDAATHCDADIVVNAMVGSRGLWPTLAALEAGKVVALANKESLVAGGDLVMGRVKEDPSRLLPVDSEHSAIFQCLAGNRLGDVERIIVTASGGRFRRSLGKQMKAATLSDALRHPTWKMGAKITIDS